MCVCVCVLHTLAGNVCEVQCLCILYYQPDREREFGGKGERREGSLCFANQNAVILATIYIYIYRSYCKIKLKVVKFSNAEHIQLLPKEMQIERSRFSKKVGEGKVRRRVERVRTLNVDPSSSLVKMVQPI